MFFLNARLVAGLANFTRDRQALGGASPGAGIGEVIQLRRVGFVDLGPDRIFGICVECHSRSSPPKD